METSRMYAFERILVPSDLSKCARKALGLAISLAVRYDAELFLLYVDDAKPDSGAWKSHASMQAEMNNLEDNEQKLLAVYEEVAAEVSAATGLPEINRDGLRVRVGAGEPAREILAAADDARIDLVVMGTHGRTGIKEFFVGSTTERVVERATCNVLTVKPDGYPYLRD